MHPQTPQNPSKWFCNRFTNFSQYIPSS